MLKLISKSLIVTEQGDIVVNPYEKPVTYKIADIIQVEIFPIKYGLLEYFLYALGVLFCVIVTLFPVSRLVISVCLYLSVGCLLAASKVRYDLKKLEFLKIQTTDGKWHTILMSKDTYCTQKAFDAISERIKHEFYLG